MRRAEYAGGAGRLSVRHERLLFVGDGQHSAVEDLERAVSSEHPGRALATVVTQSGFQMPPFVFARVGDRLQGIVYGPVQLEINDGDVVIVDGAEADPWRHFDASISSTLTCGDSELRSELWVEVGVVCAGSFRWSRRHGGVAGTDYSLAPESASWEMGQGAPTGGEAGSGTQSASVEAPTEVTNEGSGADNDMPPAPETEGQADGLAEIELPDSAQQANTGSGQQAEPATVASVDSAPDSSDRAPMSPGLGPSLRDALDSEFDATIDAIRFAEIRSNKDDQEASWPKRRGGRAELVPAVAGPVSEITSDIDDDMIARLDEGSDDEDATIDLGPGQVMLDSLHAGSRMVEALLCLECENPNPPPAVRCRYCAARLASTDTDIREVPQPVLGVIHLSGGREELLDADLLIGRNPGYLPLDRYQRAVKHAEEDRSVSRRHIELKLDQWKVMATNLTDGARTTLESRDGRRTKLLPRSPQQLRSGDTVHYGSAWLRFEPEE